MSSVAQPSAARTRLSCQGRRQTIRTQGRFCRQASPRSQRLRQQVASQFLWAGGTGRIRTHAVPPADIWLTPQVKSWFEKEHFCPGSSLLCRLRRSLWAGVLVTSAAGGGQARREGQQDCSGELPCGPPSLTWAGSAAAERRPLFGLAAFWPERTQKPARPLPPHMVLRLPAEMQLEQLTF